MFDWRTKIQFDLISDLNCEQWPKINWQGVGTSLVCVVAGNVSSNPKATQEVLFELSDNYEQVIFIDGQTEHKNLYNLIDDTTSWFEKVLTTRSNITYLDDSSAIINGCAFIGANGWWSYDYYEPSIRKIDSMYEVCKAENLSLNEAISIFHYAQEQTIFLAELVGGMTESSDIDEIILVTNAVPRRELITRHRSVLENTKSLNHCLHNIILADVNNKITTWCYGNSAENQDVCIEDVRYVSHPRGILKTSTNPVYYPQIVMTD